MSKEVEWKESSAGGVHGYTGGQMTVDIEKLKDALEKAQDLIAANRLVLGEYSGVREVQQIESRIKEAISIVAEIEK